MGLHARALATLAVLVALCSAVAGTASANRISTSSTQIRHTWPEWTVTDAGSTVTCPITLEGSVHSSTIAKTVGLLVGYINRAITGTCRGGSVTFLTTSLPWHIRYETFFGTLPNIAAISFQIVGMAFETTILGFPCLFQTSAVSPASWTDNMAAGGGVTSVRWHEAPTIPGSCGIEATFSGSGSLTQSGTTTPISITLI